MVETVREQGFAHELHHLIGHVLGGEERVEPRPFVGRGYDDFHINSGDGTR